jgi:DNA-binding PadR family transcriptional regulator
MNRSSVKNELGLFSYEILGLVGRGGASAHDLRRMARRGRMLDWAGESQYYAEPKRLARLGFLATHTEPGQTRERTVYTLTEKGLDALRAYAATPVRFTPVKSEPLLRLMIADLVGETITRESMATLRQDIAELSASLDDAVRTAAMLPHRERNLLLVIKYLRRLLDLHIELVAEVEREFASE